MPGEFVFPTAILRQQSEMWCVTASTLTSGQSAVGAFQVVRHDGGGLWRAQLGRIAIMTPAQIKTWRQMSAIAENGATPFILQRCEKRQFPTTVVAQVVSAAVALRATFITVGLTTATPLEVGLIFSIQHPTQGWRMYEVKQIGTPATNWWDLVFRPPLREAVAIGTPVEFQMPRCVMRLASPEAMNLDLETGRFGQPTVDFIEHFYQA
jgi:hypothetical protein